jgi:hypothetical protein
LQQIQSRLKNTGYFYHQQQENMDHILNHDLVCENPAAATFVGTIERSMQEIKEEFNKVVLSIIGSNLKGRSPYCC